MSEWAHFVIVRSAHLVIVRSAHLVVLIASKSTFLSFLIFNSQPKKERIIRCART